MVVNITSRIVERPYYRYTFTRIYETALNPVFISNSKRVIPYNKLLFFIQLSSALALSAANVVTPSHLTSIILSVYEILELVLENRFKVDFIKSGTLDFSKISLVVHLCC